MTLISKINEEKIAAQQIYSDKIVKLTNQLYQSVFFYMNTAQNYAGDDVKLFGSINVIKPTKQLKENESLFFNIQFSLNFKNPENSCSQIMLSDFTKINFNVYIRDSSNEEIIKRLHHSNALDKPLSEFENIEELLKTIPQLCATKDNPLSKFNNIGKTYFNYANPSKEKQVKTVVVHDQLIKFICYELTSFWKKYNKENKPIIQEIENEMIANKLNNDFKLVHNNKKRIKV